MHILDTAGLTEVSSAISRAGGRIRDLRAGLRSRAAAMHWDSPAAAAFALELDALLLALGALADGADRLAEAVAEHRDRAAHALRLIEDAAAAAARAAEAVGGAVSAAGGAVGGAVSAAGGAVANAGKHVLSDLAHLP